MALDSRMLGTFHEVLVTDKKPNEKIVSLDKAEDYFIGRFESDGEYHLLGYRPSSLRYMFSVASESNKDMGVVSLPKKKKNLSDLVRGEPLTVTPNREGAKPYKVFYLGTDSWDVGGKK